LHRIVRISSAAAGADWMKHFDLTQDQLRRILGSPNLHFSSFHPIGDAFISQH